MTRLTRFLALVLCGMTCLRPLMGEPALSEERVVMTTDFGDIELGFYPEIAPVTVAHILKLFQLGAYNTNHIFRVHKGFVLQVASISNGRLASMNTIMKKEEAKTMPLEVSVEVRHVRGVISMARHEAVDSGTSSFSMLLGKADHLNMEFTIFGRVIRGFDAIDEISELDYTESGIFRIPNQRVGIHSTYWYSVDGTCRFNPTGDILN